MMHLSRVRVDSQALDGRRLRDILKGNQYGNHQLLWKLFPEAEGRPFLFRQELEREAGHGQWGSRGLPMFYVLSAAEPVPVPGLLTCESKAFDPRLREGQRLAFRLRANPVVARKDPERSRSRRHDVLMDAKQAARNEGVEDSVAMRRRMEDAARAWLGDAVRAEAAGYVLAAEPEVHRYQQHVHRRKGGEIRFSSVDYEGLLEVKDSERFRQTLAKGIGRSRAFGCGLWLVRPA